MGLYVAKDRNRTVVSRTGLRVPGGRGLRVPGGRRVRRAWGSLAEERVPGHQVRVDPTLPTILVIGLPTIVAVLAVLRYFGPMMALVAGLVVLCLTGFLVPRFVRRYLVRRHLGRRGIVGLEGGIELTAAAERTAFDRAVTVADRVAKTWPALDGLIDVPEAENLLAEALWEIAGGLARRQELKAVLAQLTRPDFAAAPPADATAAKLQTQIRATKEALSAVEIDLAGRLASLGRAEEAGRTLIREREMHEAIRAAERSLATTSPDPATAAAPASDPAADLAEHTHLVLTAYRELTTTLHPDDRP
ncbi:hypothetical protein [Actinoplanes subtropicus]|uniref:hypothetical protein n=1 Tax=Actinoplanes subtropicus TaxID=543632 RepID=UPI00068A333D|nr:hypothetical protein [Actinoplanes subtropicus]